jgi:hypothetical protein
MIKYGYEIALYEVRIPRGDEWRVSLRDTGMVMRQVRVNGEWGDWKKWMARSKPMSPEALEQLVEFMVEVPMTRIG